MEGYGEKVQKENRLVETWRHGSMARLRNEKKFSKASVL